MNATIDAYLQQLDKKECHELGLLYFLDLHEFYTHFYLPILSRHQKNLYGEVNTPESLTIELVSFIPDETWSCDPFILDSGAGLGYIAAAVARHQLSLTSSSENETRKQRWKAIMAHLTLVEINPANIQILKRLFGIHCNIVCCDYLSFSPSLDMKPTIVIGNPPFNIGGTIKVPSNTSKSKKDDGKSIWRQFITHSLHCLDEGGLLCYYAPNSWMKSDSKLFNVLLRENKLLKVKCYKNNISNILFKGHAQTPCATFLLEKGGTTDVVDHFSWYLNDFSRCRLDQRWNVQSVAVLDSVIERKIINKLHSCFGNLPPLVFHKTACVNKKTSLSKAKSDSHCYENIQTCVFDKNKSPVLKYEYSDAPCQFYEEPKIICAHGMYGLPFVDALGEFGISRRDKYIILKKDVQNMDYVAWFLSTPIASFMFENYKYRMCFIEKAGFEWLIDVSLQKMDETGFPPMGSVEQLFDWFDLNEKEIEFIKRYEKRRFTIM